MQSRSTLTTPSSFNSDSTWEINSDGKNLGEDRFAHREENINCLPFVALGSSRLEDSVPLRDDTQLLAGILLVYFPDNLNSHRPTTNEHLHANDTAPHNSHRYTMSFASSMALAVSS